MRETVRLVSFSSPRPKESPDVRCNRSSAPLRRRAAADGAAASPSGAARLARHLPHDHARARAGGACDRRVAAAAQDARTDGSRRPADGLRAAARAPARVPALAAALTAPAPLDAWPHGRRRTAKRWWGTDADCAGRPPPRGWLRRRSSSHAEPPSEGESTMQVRRSGPAMLAALAGMSLTLGWASSASAVVPGENGKIAFVGRDGDEEIFTVDPDGSDLTPLTSNAANDGAPTWSPDGRRIAFTSERDGNYEIYVMDADGSNQTRLTNVAGYDITPAWSPDGQRIAFVSNRGGDFEIYVMGADGSNPTHLTTNTAYDDQPAWSPDGAKIAFASDRAPYGADSEIYVMDADGSSQTHLTDNSRTDSDPAWSPDSQRIAFARNR